jgi:hypothetical protein
MEIPGHEGRKQKLGRASGRDVPNDASRQQAPQQRPIMRFKRPFVKGALLIWAKHTGDLNPIPLLTFGALLDTLTSGQYRR